MHAPVAKTVTSTTPGGLTLSVSGDRTAVLTDPENLLSLQTLTDTTKINGRAYQTIYTAADKTSITTTPAGRQTTSILDAQGRIVQTQFGALTPTQFTYDANGRLATATQGSGADMRTTSFTYNDAGHLSALTDPLGRTISYGYDAAGRFTTQTLPGGRTVQFAYDATGNIVSITPPGRPAHSFIYTPVDLQQTYTPPTVSGGGTGTTSYAYNLDQQLSRNIRPDGLAVDLTYDTAGRLATQITPTGTTTYTYAPSTGTLTGISAPDGVELIYTYDGSLPLTETWAGPVAGTVARSYDNDFKPKAISLNGTAVTLGYDGDNLLTQAGDLTISRRAADGLISNTSLGMVTTSQDYNSIGELNTMNAIYGGSTLYSAVYTRDKLGRITQKLETVDGFTSNYQYTYDVAGRLIGETRDSVAIGNYAYDANGNRLQANGKLATYDDQDRLITFDGATFSYTANGELKSMAEGAFTTLYDYDVIGNLRGVKLPSGTAITYVIDGRNRRIGKRVGGTLVQGFLYQDQLKPLAELDGGGNVVARFIYGTCPNVPEYMIKNGVTYRFILDHLGSPRLVVNATTGAVAQRIDYDAWGNITKDTNPGFQPFGFAGGLYDSDTGLIRFGARDYDAEVGRWTEKDPIRFFSQDANLYFYNFGDPVNLIDPEGLGGYFDNLTENLDQRAAWAADAGNLGGAMGWQSLSTLVDFARLVSSFAAPPWMKGLDVLGILNSLTNDCMSWFGTDGRIFDVSISALGSLVGFEGQRSQMFSGLHDTLGFTQTLLQATDEYFVQK